MTRSTWWLAMLACCTLVSVAAARPYRGAPDAWRARRVAAVGAPADDILPGRLRSRPVRPEIIDNDKKIDVNNISMFVTNSGSFAWDRQTQGQPAGLEFPKGTGKTAVYAAGLWLGAKVNGAIRIAISEYSDEYGPGSILGQGALATFDNPDLAAYKVYKLSRVYNDSTVRNAALADYNSGAVPHGAPPVTVRGDGTLSVLGDQMLWAVYNDLDSTLHTNRAGGTGPLGIEVQQTTFAFSAQGALGNTVFIKYRFINKGPNQLNEMYVSQWADPDLGDAADDLVGCDVAKSIGFVYNASNNDGQYGSNVPCVGFDFFRGPTVGGTPLALASFNKYINGTDPNTSRKTYHYMQGLDADSNVVIDPTTHSPTSFQVPGDPVTSSGWLDTNPADRRMMLSTGPFSMAPGDTQEVVVGIVIGQSVNRVASVAFMRCNDSEAQSAFDVGFDVPPAPDPPAVIATPRPNAVLLTWDGHAENYPGPGYAFEGYAVYQGASISGPWKRIAVFDVADGITTVLDEQCDPEALVALPKVVAQGTDRGIGYQYLATQDAIRGGPLLNAMPYYFTVRSYVVNTSLVPKVKESADTVRTVVPQTPPAGTLPSASRLSVPVTRGQVVPSPAGTTDSVEVTIVNPARVINASYRVGYKPDPAGIPVWYVVRTTATGTDTVANNLTNFSGDDNVPIFDGIQVRILGAPYRQLLNVDYIDTGAHPPGFVGYGIDLGMGFFDGSADYFVNIPLGGFSSKLQPDSIAAFHNVEIRLTGGPAGQKAYRYLRAAAAATYFFQDYVDVPFTVWDIDNNRQLNAGFNEREVAGPNGMWDPDTSSDPFLRREFVVVFASDYNPTAQPFYTTQYPNLAADSPNLDLMYIFWPKQAADSTGAPIAVDNGDKILFQTASRSPNDFFTFSTTGPERGNATAVKSEFERIKVVPNPYFAHSAYELNQFNRVVKFTHLPPRCTIRIFNLAGDLVRTLEKDDNTSILSWDLQTGHQLPVGSGVYLFHVDAPGFGTHIGKMAIFTEKERLNVY